jgi:hypothetical protein
MHVSLLLNYQFLSTGLLLESSRSNVEFIKVIRYLHSCSLFQQSSTTSEALRGCTSYVVGNGLLFMFPRLYKVSSAPTATISKMRSWVNDNWVRNVNWRRTPRIFEIEQEMSLHRVLQ